MTAPVGIINYNAGNIGSMVNMFSRIGVDAVVVSDVKELDDVERLVLPGVGHFDHGVRNLKESGMYERLPSCSTSASYMPLAFSWRMPWS